MDPVGGTLALIACAGSLACAQANVESQASVPSPRVAVGGLLSIDCASSVVYAAAPDVPHRLNATYAFPDRARWWLGVGDESSPERRMRLRLGAAIHAIDPGQGASRELLAEERSEALVQIEMRRALFLWPHGFDWVREGLQSRAALPRVGTLTARFAEAASTRPVALEFHATDGAVGDEYRAITWRVENEKAWPVTLELWHAGEKIWLESVRSVDTRTRYVDCYFLPPDRRELGLSKPRADVQVRSTDLPECRVQRIGLKEGTSLEAALAEWKRIVHERRAELAPLGLALDDKVTLELGPRAKASAILLRLAPTAVPLPEQVAARFALVPERPGLSTFVIGLGAVNGAQVEALEAALPQDARALSAYVRLDPEKPHEYVLIILPLTAREAGTK